MKTKELIFNAALELFAQHGYDATTIRKIVGKVGITEGSFYNHYQSKQDVLIDILKSCDELYRRANPSIAERKKLATDHSLSEVLSVLMEDSLRIWEDPKAAQLWQVVFNEQYRNSNAREIILNSKKRRIEGLTAILELHQQQGKVISCDASTVAKVYVNSLLNQYTDYILSKLHHTDSTPFTEGLRQTINFFVNSYKNSNTSVDI